MGESVTSNKDSMEEVIFIGGWKGNEKERLNNLKYYYKKPGAEEGDPFFCMGNDRYGKPGEIVIGNEEPKLNSKPERIIGFLKEQTDRTCLQTLKIQSWYFGKDNYEPVRQANIEYIKRHYKRAQELGLDIPQEVREVVENEDWPF
jgi:hypothetical protein